MLKRQSCRVVNGRTRFKCSFCQKQRIITIPPNVRRRSIRCPNCREVTNCEFNRRVARREQQFGTVLLTTNDSREISVDLFDISFDGVGFDVHGSDMKKIKMGKEVRLQCPWDRLLFSNKSYVVKSIKGQRIGVGSN